MKPFTEEQIKAVTDWMEEWETLKGSAVPIRFREEFDPVKKKINDILLDFYSGKKCIGSAANDLFGLIKTQPSSL